MIDYAFKTTPFEHQNKVFLLSRDRESFALLMEQGTGKSKVIIDNAAWLYGQGKIDLLLIVAPNGVHSNWVINELPAHMPDYVDYKAAWYGSSLKVKEKEALQNTLQHDGLQIVTMNIEALATEKGVKFAKELLQYKDAMFVVDESTTIKNPKAIRTKAVLKLAKFALYRRILTGTPVTQGPLDLFSQFGFLDEDILQEGNYYAFRNRYAIMKEMRTAGRSFMIVDKYTNLDELENKIAPHSFRALKIYCLDLPDKLYQKHYVELSKNQARIYKELKKEAIVEFDGGQLSTSMAMIKFLRMQQVIGGFFQKDIVVDFDDNMQPIIGDKMPPQKIDDKNPRIEGLMNILDNTQGKVIIWARFRAEIAEIAEQISKQYGSQSYVEYHGGINNSDRSENIEAFQNNPKCRYFIGHVQAGGKGLTLHAASTVVYYSNDFSLENRLQSEDRAHRIGQTKNVTYIDIVAKDTLDVQVVQVLRDKKSIADMITGDVKLEEWL